MSKEAKSSLPSEKAEREKKRLSLPPNQQRGVSPTRDTSPSKGKAPADSPNIQHKFSFDDEPPIAQPYLSTKPTFIGAGGAETEGDGGVTFRKLVQRRRPTHVEARAPSPLETVALRKVSMGADAERAAELQQMGTLQSTTPPSPKSAAVEHSEATAATATAPTTNPLEESQVGRRARQVGSMIKKVSRTILPIGSGTTSAPSTPTPIPQSTAAPPPVTITASSPPSTGISASVHAHAAHVTAQALASGYAPPHSTTSHTSGHRRTPSITTPASVQVSSPTAGVSGVKSLSAVDKNRDSVSSPSAIAPSAQQSGKSGAASASVSNSSSSSSSGIERGVRGLIEKIARRDRAQQQGLDTEGATKKGCFGVPLTSVETCWVREESVPQVVVKLCTYLSENHVTETEGIFRVAGRSVDVALIREHFDRGGDLQSAIQEKTAASHVSLATAIGAAASAALPIDLHSIAGALKLWFRLLPDPIFTFALYPKWIAAQQMDSDERRLTRLWELLSELPALNRTIILYTARFLRAIADARDHTLMTSSSLGTIMGSLMLRSSSVLVAESPLSDVLAFQRAGQVMRAFIEHVDILANRAHPPDFSADGAAADSLLRSQGGSLINRPASDSNARKLAMLPRLDIPLLEGEDAFQHNSPRRPRMGQIASTAPQMMMAGGAVALAPHVATAFASTIDDHDPKPKFPLRPLPLPQVLQIRNVSKAGGMRSLRDDFHLPRGSPQEVAGLTPDGFWRKCFFALVLAMIAARVFLKAYRSVFGE